MPWLPPKGHTSLPYQFTMLLKNMKYKFDKNSDQYHYINSLAFAKKQIREGVMLEDITSP
jgi:aconitase A